jgi:signal transduction histidine kinase
MSDAWGTVAVPVPPGHAARGNAEPANAGVNVPPEVPQLDVSAAGRPLAVEALTAVTDPKLARRFRQYATWCGILVMAIGCAGVVGLLGDVRVLASIYPGWSNMKANTALGLIAAGAALIMTGVRHGENNPERQMSRLCAAAILVIGSATLAEYLWGIDLGIDQLLVVDLHGAAGIIYPGRMAPLAAVNFITFGMSLLTMASDSSRWQMPASVLSLLSTVASMVVVLGYIFGASELYTVSGRFNAVAANTSIAFFVLGIGILFADLPNGPLRSLASPYLGGMMLRRVLPLFMVFMTAIVWIRLVAQAHGVFDSLEMGAASVAVVTMISVGGILIWHAGVLDQLDGARRRSDEQIRRLNATLNSRVIALEAANREFQGLSYSMSHVLRAPLRAIHGYAQIVLDELGEKLDAEGRRLLGVVQSSTEEMSELLDGILAFLRLGWQPMTIVPVDMHQSVSAAIEQLNSKTAGRNVRFDVGELPDAQADASLVQRIWLNLLDNAVKFTAGKDAARIEVGAQSDGDRTVYFVKDNGAGFDMQYVANLFGVFRRLHAATQFPGTGIGLAIVNRIVARHGGRVWAEARPDAGATFYFSLALVEKTNV